MNFWDWETNELIISFVINNIILLGIIKKCMEYVVKKTPWAWDDDLASFFGGLVNMVKNRKGTKIDDMQRTDKNTAQND